FAVALVLAARQSVEHLVDRAAQHRVAGHGHLSGGGRQPVPGEVAAQQRAGRLPAPVPIQAARRRRILRRLHVPELAADPGLDEVVLQQRGRPQRVQVGAVQAAAIVVYPAVELHGCQGQVRQGHEGSSESASASRSSSVAVRSAVCLAWAKMSARSTRRPCSAEATAASTMARLQMLRWISPDGAGPPSNAVRNSASAASRPSSASGSGGRSVSPSRPCSRTSVSPSQLAVPPAALPRQSPFHDVSRPSAHQLPEYEKRAPSANAKTASAAASPSYQLHDGLNSSQYTDTGSVPSTNLAWSKVWIAMSMSSGCGIRSRNPPNLGFWKNRASS